ncbi:kinase-like protein [Rhizophagus irregularis]|uniref:Kinase-like protein n=2 Tax=Rhizophagus irregularis TaxID=588596 RepID=A0A2N0R3N2_9GLOM|nr:kinase-like protein [Rhizophagus irregularis]
MISASVLLASFWLRKNELNSKVAGFGIWIRNRTPRTGRDTGLQGRRLGHETGLYKNERGIGLTSWTSSVNVYIWTFFFCRSASWNGLISPYRSFRILDDMIGFSFVLASDSRSFGWILDLRALEWIPYDRLNDIKYIASSNFGNMYGANWIDGYILHWDFNNWERKGQNMFVVLKNLDNLNDITPEFTINEIAINHKVYGITQDPEAKIYMVVCNEICEKCNSSCLATHFHHNFESWTSGNNNIDKFIQDTQLSIHSDYKVSKALEWIPYDRFCGIKYFTDDEFGKVYLANWIDGYISYWDSEDHKIGRKGENMFIILKMLNNPNNIASEFANKVMIYLTFYGITQDPETKNYMFVCNEICEKCNCICFAMHFQRNFENWTSGNDNINIHIQHTQLSAHSDQLSKVLEWIHYDKLCNVEYLAEDENSKIYQANWIDGYIVSWDDNWKRGGQNMFVSLKTLDNPNDITSEFKNKITIHDKVYGITQDPETKNYMLVLSNICKKCNCTCLAMHFHQNFVNWTSSNDDIDKFIQNIQLSIHSDYEVSKALEWIPYNRFYNIKYIAKGGFGKIYRANWYDGYMQHWDYEKCKWSRQDQNKFVALKSLDNSKNVTLEFMNEITWHYKVNDLLHAVIKFYGITQDPITKNYMMVLNYVENGSLRDFLNTSHDKLNWYDRLNCLWIIAYALNLIHKNNLIHRDLHVGNILYDNNTRIYITDMGLCKSADYNVSENSKKSAYGILPYMAPEILRGQNCTKAADIYSFGIIMYEVISGLPPYHDMNHNNLAIRICKGLRPRFNIKVPQLIVHLIKRCLDANPLNRPTANEIYKIIREWHDKRSDYQITELQKQIEESEGTNKNLSIKSTSLGLSCNTRSEAIYTSGLLNCNSNLPEPKNSDDYYEQNDDIVSMEFTESLQIDISQLKNSDSITSDDYSEYSGSIQINIEDHDSKS